jgi:hypothetical protein
MRLQQLTKDATLIPVYSLQDLGKRMKRVLNVIHEAEEYGFYLDGFLDENDLLRKMRSLEMELLSGLYESYLDNDSEVEMLEKQIVLEQFHGIACRILDALDMH